MPDTPEPRPNYRILFWLYALLAVSVLLVLFCIVKINSVLIQQSLNYKMHLQYHIANDTFRQGTDLLTEAVRRYVVTMKPEYMENYFDEAHNVRHRDKAVEMIRHLEINQSLKDAIHSAMEASKGLMATEYHAMHLIADGCHTPIMHEEISDDPLTPDEHRSSLSHHHMLAQELLWNDAYIETKNNIYSFLAQGLENASQSAMSRHLLLRKDLVSTLYLFSGSLLLLVMTISGLILYRRAQHEHMVEEQAREIAKMNVQLKEERDKSIQAEKAKSYFFSSVSHDIRTPLNAIIGFSEMLQLGIDDPQEKEKALSAIITSGHTLLELINDVLDLSKLEAGKMEMHPAPTNVAALVSNVAASFEAATTRVSVRLNAEVQKMPFLRLDPQRIRQILFNLIGNAVKFTKKGFVTIRASYDKGTFTLAVADTGCGISQENIKKLMSPYVQLQDHDSTTGTGLGLAICKQLATQMNGTLEISSTLGKGSTFTLRAENVAACSEQESEAYIHEQNASKPNTELNNAIIEKNILVVDDQKLNQDILRTMLARLGLIKVTTAGNGQEALEAMRSAGNIDIVLTDMFMPIMDGDALVSEIRKSPEFAAVSVYVITADVEMQKKYKSSGFDGILIKPITLEKLKGLLAHYAPHAAATLSAANRAKA